MTKPSSRLEMERKTRELTLEQELGEIFDRLTARATPGGRQGLRLRLGLTGAPPASLETAGSAVGLTRERIRQIEGRFVQALQELQPPTPVLDEALRVAQEILPTTDVEIERTLAERGLTKEGFSFRSLVKAAKLLGRSTAFSQDSVRDVIYRAGSELPRRFVLSQARGLTLRWGASTFDILVAELARVRSGVADRGMIRLHLDAMPSFEWLDDEHEWFWVKNAPPSNRLLVQIEKVMAVVGSIEIGDLRGGVARHPRMEGFRPPREALARLCVQSDRYRREGDRILQGDNHRSWASVLGPSLERRIVEALFAHGPVMGTDDLERAVTGSRTISRGVFQFHLLHSPALTRYAPGVYGLRGARVTPAQAEALVPPRLQDQRLLDHRWSEDGRAWIAHRVTSAVLAAGTLPLPAALRGRVTGAYTLASERGWLLGTLRATETELQDLGPFFQRWGLEEGDHVLVTLDVVRGLATATSGGEELLLRFQPGE